MQITENGKKFVLIIKGGSSPFGSLVVQKISKRLEGLKLYKIPSKFVDRTEKITRNFLCLGAEDLKKDRFCRWDACCMPKGDGGWVWEMWL